MPIEKKEMISLTRQFQRLFVCSVIIVMNSLGSSAKANAAANECENWGPTEWVDHLNASVSVPFLNINWSGLTEVFQNPICAIRIENLGLKSCTHRFSDMVSEYNSTYNSGAPAGYGEIPASEYLDRVQDEFPGLFDLPGEFNETVPSNWDSIAKKNGWEYIWKQTGEQRGILHIPASVQAGGYDQWLNIGPHEQTGAKPMVLAMVTIHKWKSADGVKHFTPFFTQRMSAGYDAPLGELVTPGRCINCHVSGYHQVFIGGSNQNTLAYPGSPSEMMKHFNRALPKQYGELDWRGWYHPEKLGPPMVARQWVDDGSHPGQKIWEPIPGANCAECHDGVSRGVLNLGSDWKHISEKIRDGSMPPGYAGDHAAVISALKDDYSNQLRDWLNLRQCP